MSSFHSLNLMTLIVSLSILLLFDADNFSVRQFDSLYPLSPGSWIISRPRHWSIDSDTLIMTSSLGIKISPSSPHIRVHFACGELLSEKARR